MTEVRNAIPRLEIASWADVAFCGGSSSYKLSDFARRAQGGRGARLVAAHGAVRTGRRAQPSVLARGAVRTGRRRHLGRGRGPRALGALRALRLPQRRLIRTRRARDAR